MRNLVNLNLYLLLVFILIILIKISAIQAISVSLTDAYVNLGRPFWWDCVVDGEGSTQKWSIHWRFEDADIGGGDGGDDGGMATAAMDNGTLYFKQVTEKNLGQYSCVVSGGQTASETTAFLRKAYVSDVISVHPETQSVQMGSSSVFGCVIDAKPEASVTITWYHNDNKLNAHDDNDDVFKSSQDDNGNFTLEVLGVSYNSAGVYNCVVDHPALTQPIVSDGMTLRVYGQPIIVDGGKPVSAPVGYNISLPCRVQSNPGSTVTWRIYLSVISSNTLIKSTPSSSTPSSVTISKGDPPISIVQSVISLNDDGDLILISNASENSSGIYLCEWSNEYGSVVSNTSLTIGGSPEPPEFLVAPKNVDILEGSDLRLQCTGKGNPSVSVSWSIDNGTMVKPEYVEVNENGSYFVIRKINEIDAGVYTCILNNSEGTNTTDATVNVLFKPYFKSTPSNITVDESSFVEIPCKADGNPIPIIKWKVPWLDGAILSSSNNSIKDVIFNGSNIVIQNAESRHYGPYQCTATNTAGSVSILANIQISSVPIIVSSPTSVGVTEGDEVLMQCEVKSYQNPNVDWYRKHLPDPSMQAANIQNIIGIVSSEAINTNGTGIVKIQSTENTGNSKFKFFTEAVNGNYIFYLQISDIQESEAGVYVCNVENDKGSAHAFGVVRVISYPYFTIVPSGRKILPGEDATLHCHSAGIPVPSQRWLFEGGKLIANSRFVVFSNGSLSINNISLEEIGTYTCLATNQAGQRSVSATLLVSSKPTLTNPPTNQTFSASKSGHLRCEGQSRLPYSVLWYTSDEDGNRVQLIGTKLIDSSLIQREGEGVSQINESDIENNAMYVNNNGSLVFQCIDKLLETWYLCELKNEDGNTTSDPIFVRVDTLPKAISLNVSNSDIQDGDSIEFTCSIQDLSSSSTTNGNITWITPQFVEITKSGHSFFTEINIANDEIIIEGEEVDVSVLMIESVSNDRHSGDWWCKTCNGIGCTTTSASVSIQGKPAVDGVIVLDNDNQNQITLRCFSYGSPAPEISYILNGQDITNDTEGHIIVNQDLIVEKDAMEKQYSCRVRNIHGSDSKMFGVPAIPTVTETVPGETTLKINTNIELPYPHLSLTGIIIDYKSDTVDEWISVTHEIKGDPINYLSVFKDVQQENSNNDTCVKNVERNIHMNTPKINALVFKFELSIESSGASFIYSFELYLKSLSPYTLYSVRSTLMNGIGRGVFSNTVSVRTLPSAPPEVTNVAVSVSNITTTLTWNNPIILNGRAENIDININIVHKPTDVIVDSKTIPVISSPMVLFLNLPVGMFTAKITVFNTNINVSGKPTTFDFHIQDQPSSFIPAITEVRSIKHSSFLLIWTTPENSSSIIPPVTGYIVRVQSTDFKSNARKIQINNGDTSQHTLTNLKEHEEYTVQVASKNDAGISPYSSPKRVTTQYAAFSEMPLHLADIGNNHISWTLLAVIIISFCSALIFFVGFLVVSYQFRLTKRGRVDITPEPTPDIVTWEGRGHDRPEDETGLVETADYNFMLY